MALTTAISVTPFERRYRARLDDLLAFSCCVHTHLDWHDAGEWLDRHTAPARLAWLDGRLVGLLIVSEPLHAAAWVRLAAVDDAAPARPVLEAMWRDLLPELQAAGLSTVSILVARNWIEDYLAGLGFAFDENVVTLQRNGPPPEAPAVPDLTLRQALPADLAHMVAVDHAAFSPPWQLSLADLCQAQRVASSSTVAVLDAAVVGYQISTLYRDGAHLARLAVTPAAQGQGIGAALVTDVIGRFARRGVALMTVNTQASNRRSQRLYQRLGFRHNGYDLPVWTAGIAPQANAAP
ncbi:MAG: GNAT family N-acetyltransferase [Aggregatilineales bacterium]